MALKDEYRTISQAAKEMKVTRQTVARWIKEGKLPAEKVGREVLIKKDALDEYTDERIGKWLVPLFSRHMIKFLRKEYKYPKDASIEVIDVKPVINENWFGDMIFEVKKKDGTVEKPWMRIGKVELDKKEPMMHVDIKKISKEPYRRAKKSLPKTDKERSQSKKKS